jgi:putative FmdB family regulatory protein
MPTYEYECLEAGHRFEEFQSITEPPLETCPICGGKARRLISGGAGILFKGSGFYQTDYRSDSYRKAERAEKSGKPKEGGDTGPSVGEKGKGKKSDPASGSGGE